jgi:biopolymer transport protein ExbD
MLRRPEIRKIATIDMSPMIGVLQALLIVFMVITPIYGCGVSVELPHMSPRWLTESPDRVDALTVGIDERERLYLNGKRLEGEFEELQEGLQDFLGKHPETARAYMKADIATRFRTVQRVAEACRKAGVPSILFITEPDVREEMAEGMRILAAIPHSN